MSKSDIPEKVRALLWAKSAGRCEFDNCNELLWRDGVTQIEMNFGDVAHIIGDSPNGPRGHPKLSKEYCNDVSNLMLMCLKHHKMIDEITKTYSAEALRKMKQVHEERIELLTGISPQKTSNVLIYTGKIGNLQPNINASDALSAISNEGWYPASLKPIELGMGNYAMEDHEKEYWKIQDENLYRQFTQKISPLVSHSYERPHFSVFAFAPQPLLIKLGTLLSEMYPAEVYQLHREPNNWKWQPDLENFNYHISEAETQYSLVALNLSLSASIESERIRAALGTQDFSEWKISIDIPNNDFLQSRMQLMLLRQEFRQLLNRIKTKHGEKAVIHLFPAVPISIAIEIGRVRQQKADLPYIIYDQNSKNGGFIRTLEIGEIKND